MAKKPCCPASAARMVKKINVGGIAIGIIQLDEIMDEVYRMDLGDISKVRKGLLRLVKIYNYVPSAAEDEYADAILEEYKKFCRTRGAK